MGDFNNFPLLYGPTRRACERPIRTCIVFLNHVQNLQIHAVRANILTCFSEVSKQYIETDLGTGVGKKQLGQAKLLRAYN